jgi:hypothetical protein
MTTGQYDYGQAGQYNAIDDRRVITALAAGRAAGVVTPVALSAGAGLNVVVAAGWLAVASAGDGTLGVLGSGSSITVAGNAGDAGAARTDALWADVSPTTGQFTLAIMPQSATAGRIGIQLATLTVPANANLASAFTLAPAAATFGNFAQGVSVGPNSLWTLSATPDPYLRIAQGPFIAGTSLPLYVSKTGVLTAANPADGTPEVWHPVGAASGWQTMAGYAAGIIYRMMPDGRVQFSGAASHTASASTIPINNTAPLAAAYRPQSIKVLADGNTPLARMAVEYRTDGILYAVNNSGTSTATQAIVDKAVSLYDTG